MNESTDPTGTTGKWTRESMAAHKARIEFMEAMGQAHYSRTDAQWHVAHFAKTVGAELEAENAKLRGELARTVPYANAQASEITKIRKEVEKLEGECAERFRTIERIGIELTSARLQVNAMRPVVEAAITWKKNEKWPYLAQGGSFAHAIDAYEKTLAEKRIEPSPISEEKAHAYGTCNEATCLYCKASADADKRKCEATKLGASGVGYGYPLKCSLENGHQPPHRNEAMNAEWD